jgi:hypothetical protein
MVVKDRIKDITRVPAVKKETISREAGWKILRQRDGRDGSQRTIFCKRS